MVWQGTRLLSALTVLVAIFAGAARIAAQTQDNSNLDQLNAQVRSAFDAGDYAKALPVAERALALAEKQFGPNDAKVALQLNDLARLYWALGRYVEAEPLYQRALTISEKSQGPDHPDVAVWLTNLADLYAKLGRYPDAEAHYKRALAIREKALGPNDTNVATTLNNMAEMYWEQDRYAEAEPLYKRALSINEKALGPEDPNVASFLNNLAGVYFKQGRYPETETLLRRALDIRQKKLPPTHPDIAFSLNNLGALYQTEGRLADAEPLYKQALDIRQRSLPPDHPDVAYSLNNLAELYRAQGRYADAEPLYKQALERRRTKLGRAHKDVAVSMNSLGLLYRAQGRDAEAEPLLKEALDIAERALGPDTPDVAVIRENLGVLLKSEGRLNEAAPLLERAVEDGERALGPKHPQVVSATTQLAELYGLQGRTADSERLFAKARAAKSVDLKEIPIYFGTDRKRDLRQQRIAFTNERGPLNLGIVKVIVPPPNAPTAADAAKKQPERISDMRQLSIMPIQLMDMDFLIRAARERLAGANTYPGEALVFVHGFNVSFDNAVRRAGQLAYDLSFDGPVFLFSWPTAQSIWGYVRDRDTAEASDTNVREFLQSVVAGTNARSIHIIAHSMGTVAVNEALRGMDEAALSKLKLGELVLASPDVDRTLFQQAYDNLQKHGAKSTIYTASSDWALWVSSWLHSPLGYLAAAGPTKLFEGSDLIDITAVNADVFSLNHDHYADSPAVIGDLRQVLTKYQPPDVRTRELVKMTVPAGTYWQYKKVAP